MNIKKKKNIVNIILLLLIGVVGVTFSYFGMTSSFKNVFKTEPFNSQVTEVFESPENWTPGTTTAKEIYATNTSNVDAKVRIKYTEKWVSANGTEMSLEQDGNRAAIINLANTSDWTLNGDYYYFNEVLKPGETTTSFMESVTFNPLIEAGVECVTENNHSVCTSTGDGYDGATYTLAITIEMYQADMTFEEAEEEEEVATEPYLSITSSSATVAAGEEITLTIAANALPVPTDGSDEGFGSINLLVNYDATKFTLVSSTATQGSEVPNKTDGEINTIVSTTSGGITGEFYQIVLKALDDVVVGDTDITVSSLECWASDAVTEISLKEAVTTITVN